MGLSLDHIASLLAPYLSVKAFAENELDSSQLCERVSVYLELLLRWNARINLTAISFPEEIVTRHFGESFFAAVQLRMLSGTALDLGSGAGFPGIPIQLICPNIRMSLAESQHKKVAFLREVIRALGLQMEVWPHRTEEIPAGSCFDLVALRAVDKMESALSQAARLASKRVLLLGTRPVGAEHDAAVPGFSEEETIAIPNSERRVVRIFHKN